MTEPFYRPESEFVAKFGGDLVDPKIAIIKDDDGTITLRIGTDGGGYLLNIDGVEL